MSTKEVAIRITNQVAIGCWRFQSEGWLIDAIDKALRQREKEARAAEQQRAVRKVRELRALNYEGSLSRFADTLEAALMKTTMSSQCMNYFHSECSQPDSCECPCGHEKVPK